MKIRVGLGSGLWREIGDAQWNKWLMGMYVPRSTSP